MRFPYDRYLRYEELTEGLCALAAEVPNLVRMESIGRSYEGRDIWLLRVTDWETGPDTDKPAVWADGNIHASELSASTACLRILDRLVSGYQAGDPIVRELLGRVAFYICPRVSPDGAEWALEESPRIVRSSTRPHPFEEEPIGGLKVEDVDGDGRILQMRIPDPNGPWKLHPDEPRLLIRREPEETGGQYYRLLPEGTLEDYDGALISIQPKRERLDLNRNFPAHWRPEHEQPGAGPYPTSEPEVRAIADFIARHRNIGIGVAFHTFSGVLLRPYSHQSDEAFPAEDLWTYQKIGEKGTQITGYPAVSVFHDFKYHPNRVITGVFDDWLYDHLGLFGWTVEIWSPQRRAGIQDYAFIDWFREHPPEDDLKLLRWSDEQLDGKGYVDWYPFEHPQLGPVELGGWDHLYAWRNPPPKFLEEEVTPLAEWVLWLGRILPRLELFRARVRPLGEGLYEVECVVQNTGWLPTYITKKALERKTARETLFEIVLPEGASLEQGKRRQEQSHLEGRAYKPSAPTAWGGTDPTEDRAKVLWVVRSSKGGTVRIRAWNERAGAVQVELPLGETETVRTS